MQISPQDIAHLSALIEAASSQAERLRPDTANVAQLLGEALIQTRCLAGSDGSRDEGLRPDQLTTENDR